MELESQCAYTSLMDDLVTYTTLTVAQGNILDELRKEAAAAQKKSADMVK